MARIRLSAADLEGAEVLGPPAAAAAPTGRIRLSAADLEGAEVLDAPAAAPKEAPGKLESFGRGLAQGVTFGFADEISGALESAFTPKTYKQARDESRGNFDAAQQANPYSYMGGNIAGAVGTAFVPGLGLAKGASALANIGKAAALSGVAGLGESRSEDVGGMTWDAAKSGLVGGATAGIVGRIFNNAPQRAVNRAIGDITEGATATMRDRVVGKAGANVPNVLKEMSANKAISAAKGDPSKVAAAVEESLSKAGARMDELFAAASKKTPGIKVSDVLGEVDDVAKKLLADPGKASLGRSVAAQAEDIRRTWPTSITGTSRGYGKKVTDAYVTASQVRTLAGDIADSAFAGNPNMSPKARQEVAREVWGKLKDLIGKNIDEAAGGADDAASKELRELGKRMNTLMNMKQAAEYRAARFASPSTRLKDQGNKLLDMGLAIGSIPAYVGKKAIEHVGIPAAREFDDKVLAKLVTAANNGNKWAQRALTTAQLGTYPAVGGAVNAWMTDAMGGGGYRASDE